MIEKDLEKVRFDPSNPELYFLVRTNLSLSDRNDLVALLMEFQDIFAWSVYEAPRVSPDLVYHSLSVSSDFKFVTQKCWKLAPERCGIVMEEVRRLLAANAIQEVQYPT